jgi:SPP1 gp7 family putative phage head morphogenesis protein
MVYSPYVPSEAESTLDDDDKKYRHIIVKKSQDASAKDVSVKQWFNRKRFAAIRPIEFFYTRALIKLARTVGQFINDLWNTGKLDKVVPVLTDYSEIIEPWAYAVSQRVISDVNLQDHRAWVRSAGKMASTMQSELQNVPLSSIVQSLREEQVKLIKSIPLDAAKRVQELAFEAAIASEDRREQIAKMLQESEHVTENRAKLIARTETTRAHSIIQQARAEFIGSENYIWTTQRDRKVRKDHQELQGQVFKWSEPPIADKKYNRRAHPGQIYNCRCIAIPILPARYEINKRNSQS